jgi:hypothetical protein
MILTSLAACWAGVSSGWESPVGAAAGFFGEEPGGVFFCGVEGTLDVELEVGLVVARVVERLGTLGLRTSSSKSLT